MAATLRPVLLRYCRLSSDSIRIEFVDADGCYDASTYEAIEVHEYSAGDNGKPALTWPAENRGCVTILRCTDDVEAPGDLHEVIGELLCMPRASWSAEASAVVLVETALVDGLLSSLGGPVGEADAESVGWITRQAEALRARIEAGVQS